jgi:hypothetical protein
MSEEGVRTTYDARKPFSEMLIDVMRSIVRCSCDQAVDTNRWHMLLISYYSITKKFISSKNKAEIDTINNRLSGKERIASLNGLNKITFVAPLLIEMQSKLFGATSQLLLPSQDIDLDDEFDPTKLIEGK